MGTKSKRKKKNKAEFRQREGESNCHSPPKIGLGLGKDQYKMSVVTRLYSMYVLAACSFSSHKA